MSSCFKLFWKDSGEIGAFQEGERLYGRWNSLLPRHGGRVGRWAGRQVGRLVGGQAGGWAADGQLGGWAGGSEQMGGRVGTSAGRWAELGGRPIKLKGMNWSWVWLLTNSVSSERFFSSFTLCGMFHLFFSACSPLSCLVDGFQ